MQSSAAFGRLAVEGRAITIVSKTELEWRSRQEWEDLLGNRSIGESKLVPVLLGPDSYQKHIVVAQLLPQPCFHNSVLELGFCLDWSGI